MRKYASNYHQAINKIGYCPDRPAGHHDLLIDEKLKDFGRYKVKGQGGIASKPCEEEGQSPDDGSKSSASDDGKLVSQHSQHGSDGSSLVGWGGLSWGLLLQHNKGL